MKTYRDTLNDLAFTQEQKAAMTEELLAAVQPRKKPVPHRRVFALAAAAAVLALTVTAGATGVLPAPQEVFSSLFGSDPAQTEIIDKIGYPIGAGDTQDGITITADAILGDTYSYAIVYSIQREDGTPLAEDIPVINDTLTLNFDIFGADLGYQGGSHGLSFFYDADPSDPAVQFVEMLTADVPISTGTASAQFRNLVLSDPELADALPLAEGPWSFDFAFAFEDSGISLPAGQSFQLDGKPATLDAVYLSPLSIQVSYTVEEEMASPGRPEFLPVLIHLTDGTTLDMMNAGCSVSLKGGKSVCQKGGLFPTILPLDTIERVTIGDLTLPVTVS